MQPLLLDPAAGQPAVVVLRIFVQLPRHFREVQLDEGGRVLVGTRRGKVQRHMAYQMPPKVQDSLAARTQGTVFQFFRQDLFPVHPAGDRGGIIRIS